MRPPGISKGSKGQTQWSGMHAPAQPTLSTSSNPARPRAPSSGWAAYVCRARSGHDPRALLLPRTAEPPLLALCVPSPPQRRAAGSSHLPKGRAQCQLNMGQSLCGTIGAASLEGQRPPTLSQPQEWVTLPSQLRPALPSFSSWPGHTNRTHFPQVICPVSPQSPRACRCR